MCENLHHSKISRYTVCIFDVVYRDEKNYSINLDHAAEVVVGCGPIEITNSIFLDEKEECIHF